MKKLNAAAAMIVLLFAFGCKSDNSVKEAPLMTDAEMTGTEVNPFLAEAPKMLAPIEIAFGDYDAMFAVSKKAQNGEYVNGQEITVDGILSITPFGTLAIGQVRDGNFFGTQLEVTGLDAADYPADKSRVKVKATMKQNPELWFFYFVADVADFTVVSEQNE